MSIRDTVKRSPMYAALMAAGIPEPHGVYPGGDPGFTTDEEFSIEWTLPVKWELNVTFEGGVFCGDATNTTTGSSTDFELADVATRADLVREILGMFEFAGHALPEVDASMNNEKHAFIERLTRWLMPERKDRDLAADARLSTTLDGVYAGKSAKIHRLVALAYLRGVRRGAGCAWEARQPVHLRDNPPPEPAPRSNMSVTGKARSSPHKGDS